ncbi:Beta-1,4-galactosyltransferase 1 [Collichthys lucidus]|uniref:Beta-1,4-galactosyltransferase n=1 Tax=Collichthys lucidus TaxID=240159 RepID=A0A4U5U7T1_COLLU|nr:Beta-1,4-galactosyltransferase 1 [Collichthys lucidus]
MALLLTLSVEHILLKCSYVLCFTIILHVLRLQTGSGSAWKGSGAKVAHGSSRELYSAILPGPRRFPGVPSPRLQEITRMPPSTSKFLGPCPDTPPGLKGPLNVDFDYKLTLDEVRKNISSPLKEGGRYKPLDCIAQQKVAIIIPFRNRHEHLKHWLYYLHPILERQQLDYGVYIINQDGEGVFNRAKLMNAGFVEALKEYDYDCFVFSDIDLVPMDDRNLYRCFQIPRHFSVAIDKFDFKLPSPANFGGVISLSKSQFSKINGFSNTFWGWGGEDDDLYLRVIFHGMSISRPDMVIGKYKMIKHVRDLHNEQNPVNADKVRHTKSTMNEDGINSLNYTVKEIVKDILYTWITVDIQAPLTV